MQPKNEGCIKNLYSDTPSLYVREKEIETLVVV